MKIIFFDSDCGLCSWAIRCILKQDSRRQFLYAPLNGETAQKELASWRKTHASIDSIVFLEKGEAETVSITYYSEAFFRIAWDLGFPWTCIGLLSFLPPLLLTPTDWVYRVIAALRKKICPLEPNKDFASHPDLLLP
ncbi:MAG: DUF393 domain-containing protein [Verrucomicrobia bacterium]|nr:DUF393 domain-containing protein [Verrucomicrobiota bacterium]